MTRLVMGSLFCGLDDFWLTFHIEMAIVREQNLATLIVPLPWYPLPGGPGVMCISNSIYALPLLGAR